MKSLKSIVVLYGGFGEEREVSLKSGEKVIDSLKLNEQNLSTTSSSQWEIKKSTLQGGLQQDRPWARPPLSSWRSP